LEIFLYCFVRLACSELYLILSLLSFSHALSRRKLPKRGWYFRHSVALPESQVKLLLKFSHGFLVICLQQNSATLSLTGADFINIFGAEVVQLFGLISFKPQSLPQICQSTATGQCQCWLKSIDSIVFGHLLNASCTLAPFSWENSRLHVVHVKAKAVVDGIVQRFPTWGTRTPRGT